jgi:hypothetical protein
MEGDAREQGPFSLGSGVPYAVLFKRCLAADSRLFELGYSILGRIYAEENE